MTENHHTGSVANTDSSQNINISGTARDVSHTTIYAVGAHAEDLHPRTLAADLAKIPSARGVAARLGAMTDRVLAAEALAELAVRHEASAVAAVPHLTPAIQRALRGRLAEAVTASDAIYQCWCEHERSLDGEEGELETAPGPADRHDAEPGFRRVYANGVIYWSPAGGAHPVWWGIADYHRRHGGSAGRLGFPLTAEIGLDGAGVVQRFQDKQDYDDAAVIKKLGLVCGASVYWSEATGAHSTRGGIGQHYESLGGARSRLNFPVEDEVEVGPSPVGTDGWQQRFRGGLILWSAPTGGVAIFSAPVDEPASTPSIAQYFEDSGGVRGPLGFPVGPRHDAALSPRGTRATLQRFQGRWPYDADITARWGGEAGGATVYRAWRRNAKPFLVHGGIGIFHERNGGAGGWLGLPLSEEVDVADDEVCQIFEGGTAFWTRERDVIAVPGEFRLEQIRTLGFPLAAEERIGDGDDRIQFFEAGVRTVRDGTVAYWVRP